MSCILWGRKGDYWNLGSGKESLRFCLNISRACAVRHQQPQKFHFFFAKNVFRCSHTNFLHIFFMDIIGIYTVQYLACLQKNTPRLESLGVFYAEIICCYIIL